MKTKRTQEITMRANPRPIRQGERVTPADAGVTLRGPSTWSDGTPVTLVWVQLAVTGEWKGHSSGPFEMTVETFDEVCRNFNARGLPLAFDYEHASEADVTSGTIPTSGAPACGWIHDLVNRGPDGLWGLVEWLDDARDAIRAGKYAYVSPALRLGGKDPVTGQPSGARITSAALTNQPFLSQLPALIAASDKAPTIAARKATVMACLSSHAECSDRRCTDLHAAATALCLSLDDQDGDADVTMRLTMAEGEAAKATLLLAERDQTIESQKAELVELRADKTRRDEAELLAEVDAAWRTHKDKRKLSDADKPLMLRLARADRSAFRSMYPHVDLEHRHLLRDLVPPAPRDTAKSLEPPPAMAETRALMQDAGMSFAEATIAVARRQAAVQR